LSARGLAAVPNDEQYYTASDQTVSAHFWNGRYSDATTTKTAAGVAGIDQVVVEGNSAI